MQIFFRNFTPTMRQYHSGFLHWLGKVTLETYLLQHHMFLISNHGTFWKPTSLHVLIPGSPRLNMLVVGIVFVLCSYYAFTVTLTLRDAFIVDEPRAMLQRTLYAALAIIAALIVRCRQA